MSKLRNYKVCGRCLEEKVETKFGLCKDNSDGRKDICKECYSIEPDIIKDAKAFHEKWLTGLIYRFNLSEIQYTDMMDFQQGCCWLCGRSLVIPKQKMSINIDHCHDTDEIRGLLCATCNPGISYVDNNIDNPIMWDRILDYRVNYPAKDIIPNLAQRKLDPETSMNHKAREQYYRGLELINYINENGIVRASDLKSIGDIINIAYDNVTYFMAYFKKEYPDLIHDVDVSKLTYTSAKPVKYSFIVAEDEELTTTLLEKVGYKIYIDKDNAQCYNVFG